MPGFIFYAGFLAFVVAMLLVDLKFFHSEATVPSARSSANWVAVWIALAVAFGVGIYFFLGSRQAAEYFAGYLIEYSLSVDNIFVFLVIFNYFRVPAAFQHRVLFFGILGAIVFRGLFIAVGVTLINRFEWVIYGLGVLLMFTAYRLLRGAADIHPEDNPVLKLFKRRFRSTTAYDEQKLFTVIDGRRLATPLFVVLLMIETTDIVFAVDSIPAIFAVTRDPFIVLTSNVFAILGLRALYFLLAGVMDKLRLLRYGLAVILGFVGVKMLLNGVWHPPIALSLGVIIGVLAVTAVVSLLLPPEALEEPEEPAQAPGPPRLAPDPPGQASAPSSESIDK